jgi:hypothetical protein
MLIDTILGLQIQTGMINKYANHKSPAMVPNCPTDPIVSIQLTDVYETPNARQFLDRLTSIPM